MLPTTDFSGKPTAKINRKPAVGFALAAFTLLALCSSWHPVAAQVPSASDPSRCAALNMAHYYLRCGIMSFDMNKLMNIEIGEAGGKASKVQQDAAALMARHANGFVQIATNLYRQAGHELTPEIVQERRKIDQKEIEEVFDWHMKRKLAFMTALAKGKKPPEGKPHPLLDLCALPNLGGEIYDPNRVQARFEGMLEEAKQLRSTRENCVR